MIFGCAPNFGVVANTKMAEELMGVFEDRFEKVNCSLTFPEVFDNLQSVDANFEMAASNTIQNLRFFYSKFVMTKSKGVIFANKAVFEVFEDDEDF